MALQRNKTVKSSKEIQTYQNDFWTFLKRFFFHLLLLLPQAPHWSLKMEAKLNPLWLSKANITSSLPPKVLPFVKYRQTKKAQKTQTCLGFCGDFCFMFYGHVEIRNNFLFISNLQLSIKITNKQMTIRFLSSFSQLRALVSYWTLRGPNFTL